MPYEAHGHEHGLGRVEHPETPLARAAFPITDHPDYAASDATYRYWYEGGAWLDQGQTGTCVFNAFGHRFADGPVPQTGETEAIVQSDYVSATGDTSKDRGTSGLVACRYYMADGRISAYHWASSQTDFQNGLLSVGTWCIGIPWYNSMFTPKPRYSTDPHYAAYLSVDKASGIAGGHEIVINGINLAPAYGQPFFRLKNSWGQSWGYKGTARILVPDLMDLIFNQGGDAVLITETGKTA